MCHDESFLGLILISEEFVEVAKTTQISEGTMKSVKMGDAEILIANIEGKYYAMANKCTHRGGDLSKGTLSGKVVTCPGHGFKFDITTGKIAYAPYEVRLMRLIKPEITYEVQIQGESILLKNSTGRKS